MVGSERINFHEPNFYRPIMRGLWSKNYTQCWHLKFLKRKPDKFAEEDVPMCQIPPPSAEHAFFFLTVSSPEVHEHRFQIVSSPEVRAHRFLTASSR